MIYKSHLIITHSLHISGTFTCSPIVKVCATHLAGPSETTQNSTNSWSRFAKEFGSRLNWQTGNIRHFRQELFFEWCWCNVVSCHGMECDGMSTCYAHVVLDVCQIQKHQKCWKVLEYIEIQNIILCGTAYIHILPKKGKRHASRKWNITRQRRNTSFRPVCTWLYTPLNVSPVEVRRNWRRRKHRELEESSQSRSDSWKQIEITWQPLLITAVL